MKPLLQKKKIIYWKPRSIKNFCNLGGKAGLWSASAAVDGEKKKNQKCRWTGCWEPKNAAGLPLDWLLRTKNDHWRLLRSPDWTKRSWECCRRLQRSLNFFFQNKQNEREDERALWLWYHKKPLRKTFIFYFSIFYNLETEYIYRFFTLIQHKYNKEEFL